MKNFRVNLIFRVLLICLTIFLGFYFYYEISGMYPFIAILLLLFLFQLISLIRYVDLTNKEISRFFLSIKYSDFTQTFSNKKLGNSFTDLFESFNEVIKKFRDTRNEKEEHYRYLQTVMQHVGIGLLSFDEDGKVEFINRAAKKIFKIPYLKDLETMKKFSPELHEKLLHIKPSEKTIVKVLTENEIQQLYIYVTEFKLRNRKFNLAAIQNIQSELEEKEMEAWQNLIRVLTHEIMNSVTPISSLSATARDLLENYTSTFSQSDDNLQDVITAMRTIQKRSEGLIHFVESYRSLTKLPKPDFQLVSVKNMLDRIEVLLENDIKINNILFETSCNPESIKIVADAEMIEQVLINLILNSIHAVSKSSNPLIKLTAGMNNYGRIFIRVIDNGTGISESVQEKIFIPFFTTKKSGSGIGLSISKQVMRLHNGNISLSSIPGKETIFSLTFEN